MLSYQAQCAEYVKNLTLSAQAYRPIQRQLSSVTKCLCWKRTTFSVLGTYTCEFDKSVRLLRWSAHSVRYHSMFGKSDYNLCNLCDVCAIYGAIFSFYGCKYTTTRYNIDIFYFSPYTCRFGLFFEGIIYDYV